MSPPTKPGRAKGFDPRKRKSRDNARLRKLARNGSDKAARKHARMTKVLANGKARRQNSLTIRQADLVESSADAARIAHRLKSRHWGSFNSAQFREFRERERRFLDETPVDGIRGRRRSGEFRTVPREIAKVRKD